MNDNLDPRGKGSNDAGFNDDDLRDRFVVLRREEEQGVPNFSSLWRGRVRAPLGRRRWLALAGCALIVVAAILLLHLERPNRNEVSMVSITEWKAPTDFLLETPGREILQTVPEIGKWQGYARATPTTDGHSQVRKKVLH